MPKQPWYLSSWVIALSFALWPLYIPPIVGIVLIILEGKRKKRINKLSQDVGFDDLLKVEEKRRNLEQEIQEKQERKRQIEDKLILLEEEITKKRNEIVVLDEEALNQSFGFYEPKYNLESSQAYKVRLKEIRDQEKDMVKGNGATFYPENMTLDGNKKKGQALVNNIIKMTIRSFNNECDVVISKLKYNNLEASEKRIAKSFDQLNRFNKYNQVEIKTSYYDLKLQEMYLVYEYEQKKEEEKEEQRLIREQMREEAKVQKEIAAAKKKIEKEEKHFNQALNSYRDRLEDAGDDLKLELEEKIREYEERLEELKNEKTQVDYREKNARAGYVYIISNMGSFGEDTYKIGLTRRLEPMDRIKELGDASVPFLFDIHGMIFSNDAPTLENRLHQAFESKRINKVNPRKEFFHIGLEEIEEEVHKNHDATFELTKSAKAEEYYETLAIERESAKMKETTA